jgi:hypothetical protein
MPVQVSYPGVYIQEVPSGSRTITGVSTSVAMFVGMTMRGPLGVPTRIFSFADYQRTFGDDTTLGEMTDQVRQFFLNGGQQAYVMRIAKGADAASVTLMNEQKADVLVVTAKEAGEESNLIRLVVDYDTPSPEATFNLTVFRHRVGPTGELEVEREERFQNLTMNPNGDRYVKTMVNQTSTLVDVSEPEGIPDPINGYSLSGIVIDDSAPNLVQEDLNALLAAQGQSIRISVDRSPFATVSLPNLTPGDGAFTEWKDAIEFALNDFGVGITISLVGSGAVTPTQYVKIASSSLGGNVVVRRAASDDVAVALRLGVDQGGFEVDGYANLRPAPSGLYSTVGNLQVDALPTALITLAEAVRDEFKEWSLTSTAGSSWEDQIITFPNGIGTDPLYVGSHDAPAGDTFIGLLSNVRDNIDHLGAEIADEATGKWQVSYFGHRLTISPLYGTINSDLTASLNSDDGAAGGYDIGDEGNPFGNDTNVKAYSLGTTGDGTYQTPGTPGDKGAIPETDEYTSAYETISSEVDVFNLLLLPKATGQLEADRAALWQAASVFCQEQRAFLLIDPKSEAEWDTLAKVEDDAKDLRAGLIKDHSALYWPRIKIAATGGTTKTIDPCGSIAGVMARIDANRGVWKAPAGIEADLRGVAGVQRLISDPENGVLNGEAVNAIRAFPNGIVCWGTRTMDGFDNSGNDDYKYVPIRRLALYVEESLYRGLKFAVFEPNDEPLWAQIRLAAGAFMNNLFRQGAFQGRKASEAYFVKADSETTTQNDINLGIVNVVVGFAPLKPAEFVVITIQQKAGEIQL